ncbi:MAG: spermidine/putrescine ABC transporter ATP-binding protein [Chloroflexi bacterium RBG_13_68_17]|nr:MAG: spermidine/putrescine ABC transporter ATP-binding protein [Chloroflexi bacterium RBG_13_68_17]
MEAGLGRGGLSQNLAVELRGVSKRFGEVVAVRDVSLQVPDGEFFSLLGPSGCGKTTTLRLVGGFEMPSEGEVLIGDEIQGYKPPYQRPVNTVFQNYALFPHMSVEENVAFGLEMQKVPRPDIQRRVGEALGLVRLAGFGTRRPQQLSGGQQQRVALARALVNHPKVLLLDEPLGALDLKLRKAMQLELKALQEQVGITFVYVTHDQEEALTMSDRIAVMRAGSLLQVGTPQQVYEEPQSKFVSDFIGDTSYLNGELVELRDGLAEVLVGPGCRVKARAAAGLAVGRQVSVGFRPEKVDVAGGDPQAGDNRLTCTVADMVYTGSNVTYLLRCDWGAELKSRHQNEQMSAGQPLRRNQAVAVRWPISSSKAFPEEAA